MIPKVYVAGASSEIERCRKWIQRLGKEGIPITYDWTKSVEEFGSAGSGLRAHQLRMFARFDLQGVQDADLLWLLAPIEGKTIGAWIEFGYALSTRVSGVPNILVSPPISEKVIFARLQAVREFKVDLEAFQWILSYS